jgi:hypothetical protein
MASYAASFGAGDADAIIEHFAPSVLVATDTGSAVVSRVVAREAWPEVLSGLLASYRSLGVVLAEPLSLDVATISPRLAQVDVRWELRRADGSAVYDFRAGYTLVEQGSRWAIAAIAHNEMERLPIG